MKGKDASDGQKETQTFFRPFRSEATEQQPKKIKEVGSVTRKDLYLMSFFGFLTGGILILGLLFFTGAITGDAVLGLPGEKVVVNEETAAPVIESSLNETNDTAVEAPVVETAPVVEEVSDPCGPENEITLVLGDPYTYNKKALELKLAGDFTAQISVGGKKDLIDVGQTVTINGLKITMVDGSEANQNAVIYIAC